MQPTVVVVYLDVVPVVVGAKVDVGRSGGGHDAEPLRQITRPEHRVQQVVPPAMPLEEAAQPLVPDTVSKGGRHGGRARVTSSGSGSSNSSSGRGSGGGSGVGGRDMIYR